MLTETTEGDTGSDYCGFLCEAVLSQQDAIIEEVKELKKVNPQFAEEFKNKLINRLTEELS